MSEPKVDHVVVETNATFRPFMQDTARPFLVVYMGPRSKLIMGRYESREQAERAKGYYSGRLGLKAKA